MSKKPLARAVSVATSITVTMLALAVGAAAAALDGSGRAELDAAIANARSANVGPFHLRVDCLGERGPRQLEVFPSGVATWNANTQVTLDEPVRAALLETLQTHRFPALAASYGGRADSRSKRAALRIVCRVVLAIGGLEKSSVQLAEGEQSPELAALAGALLDRVEPLAKGGVTATDLADGLAKLASGALAPETFDLRFVRLPASGKNGPGSVLRVTALEVTLQPYEPGHEIGEPQRHRLAAEGFRDLVAALLASRAAQLPVNLWSAEQLELEISVLQHRKTTIARPFSRLSPEAAKAERERFERLVAVLDSLASPAPQPDVHEARWAP